MSGDTVHTSCFVCLRSLGESRCVKGSARLRHSNKLVNEAISDIVNETVLAPKLCFRCYRLVLGIDYHQHEVNKLLQSFTKLYNERNKSIVNNATIDINNSAMLGSELVQTEVQIQEPCNKIPIDLSEPKISDLEPLQLEFLEDDSREPVAFMSSSMENEGIMGESERDNRKGEYTDPKFNNNEKSAEKSGIELNLDGILIQPRRRLKVPKKYEDYEYYSESYSQQDGDPNVSEHPDETFEFRSPFKCNLCQNFFTSKKSFNCHECFKKEREDITYRCKGCQENFSVRRDYIKHIELCYKNVPVECHLCLSKLPSAAYLPRHIESFHKGSPANKKNTLCEHCGRGFSRKEALERHQAQVHGLAHGIHQCPQCGRTFLHTSLLAEHMRAHKGYTCAICKKIFSCMSNLNLHTKAHHQKVSSYTCSSCNKSWKFHASYTYHMRTVHGSSLLKCSVCKECFSTQRELAQHKKKCTSNGQDDSEIETAAEENIVKQETVPDSMNKSSKILSNEIVSKKNIGTKRIRTSVFSSARKRNQKNEEEIIRKDKAIIDGEKDIDIIQSPSTFNQLEEGREDDHQMMEPSSLTVEVAEVEDVDDDAKDKLLLVPELLEEDQVVYEVKDEDAVETSQDDIIVETLDDLTNDCHYVILVEEGADEIE